MIPQLILTTRNGKPVYLPDVATVRDTYKDRSSIARVNGKEVVSVTVQKRAGENVPRIAKEAMDIL